MKRHLRLSLLGPGEENVENSGRQRKAWSRSLFPSKASCPPILTKMSQDTKMRIAPMIARTKKHILQRFV